MNDSTSILKRKTTRFNHTGTTSGVPSFNRGFTLIEIMIVIAIIGILAAIALPNFLSYRQRGYDAMAKTDAKNSYDTARAYFTDFPDKTFSSAAELDSYGFRNSVDVMLTITGNADTLTITASHSNGSKTFTVDPTGKLGF